MSITLQTRFLLVIVSAMLVRQTLECCSDSWILIPNYVRKLKVNAPGKQTLGSLGGVLKKRSSKITGSVTEIILCVSRKIPEQQLQNKLKA